MQSSWHFSPIASGIRLISPLSQTSFDIETSDPITVGRILEICQIGFVSHDPTKHISFVLSVPEDVVGQIITELTNHSILISRKASGSDEIVPDRYSRQVKFFEMFENANVDGVSLDQRLRSSSIAIIGIGGYGCWISMLCARIGIKSMILIDNDTIEESNLSRQVLFSDDDVGRKKVTAAASSLALMNPNTNCTCIDATVESAESLARLIGGVDLVFNPYGYSHPDLDTLAARISRGALLAKVPCLTFGGSWIGPLTVPNSTPCYRCLFESPTILQTLPEISAKKRTGIQGAFAPRLGINCSVAVWEAARFLAGITSELVSNLINLDTINYSATKKYEITRSVICPWCAGS